MTLVRDGTAADVAAVLRIYTPYVRNGLATFEEVPPTTAAMRERRRVILAAGLPYLVAESGGAVVGYSYGGIYRPRPGYRYTVECSVYVREGLHRQGVGSALLGELIARCERGPWRQMVAIIGDSGNTGSIALHLRHGFAHVGTLRDIGFKHGRWVDTVFMQRALGPGGGTLPDLSYTR